MPEDPTIDTSTTLELAEESLRNAEGAIPTLRAALFAAEDTFAAKDTPDNWARVEQARADLDKGKTRVSAADRELARAKRAHEEAVESWFQARRAHYETLFGWDGMKEIARPLAKRALEIVRLLDALDEDLQAVTEQAMVAWQQWEQLFYQRGEKPPTNTVTSDPVSDFLHPHIFAECGNRLERIGREVFVISPTNAMRDPYAGEVAKKEGGNRG